MDAINHGGNLGYCSGYYACVNMGDVTIIFKRGKPMTKITVELTPEEERALQQMLASALVSKDTVSPKLVAQVALKISSAAYTAKMGAMQERVYTIDDLTDDERQLIISGQRNVAMISIRDRLGISSPDAYMLIRSYNNACLNWMEGRHD
jgi:hypothetical protein